MNTPNTSPSFQRPEKSPGSEAEFAASIAVADQVSVTNVSVEQVAASNADLGWIPPDARAQQPPQPAPNARYISG